MNLGITIYIGSVKPFNCREKNYLEMFNETFVTIVTWHSLFFTDLVPTRENRFQFGWSMIFFMVLNAACNMTTVIKLLVRNIYLVYVKARKVINHFLNPESKNTVI